LIRLISDSRNPSLRAADGIFMFVIQLTGAAVHTRRNVAKVFRAPARKGLTLAVVFTLCLLSACSKKSVRLPESHFVAGPAHKNLVVFVHGVLGDMDNTWDNPVTHKSWPVMLSEDLPEYDVFVYGYLSPLRGSASNVYELSVKMLQDFKDRGFFANYDNIYFITHSMGGLIAKRALDSLNTAAERANLQRVRLVLFISVPSSGANVAAFVKWMSRNPQFSSMDPAAARDFLQSTEGEWETLLRDRTASAPFPRTFSAYETRSVSGFVVVPELYISHASDASPVPFDYDHIAIVKPRGKDTDIYIWAKARILEASAYRVVSDQASSLLGGHLILYNAFQNYTQSGFNFGASEVVSWDSGRADILVSNTQPPQSNALFFTQEDSGGVYIDAPQDKGANAGLIKMAARTLEEVKEAPLDGYLSHWFTPELEGVYCVRARDGHHFAKIKVTDLRADRIAFDWVYQPGDSRRF
jgi:pimeloyl-ACP methyl ester carboxylesterase